MRTPSLLVLSALLLLPLFALPTTGAEQPVTIEQFLEIPTLNSPRLSPDASKLAYIRRQRSLEEDKTLKQLWIVHLTDGHLQRISYATKSPSSIGWRPDGSLSYIAEEDGTSQVFINPLDGSEPRAVTEMENDVQAYWWSPDGALLALLATGETSDDSPDDGPVGITAKEEDAEGKEPESEEVQERGDWEVFDRLEHPEDYPQLFVVDVDEDLEQTEARQLTTAPFCAYHVAWSPDGSTIALTYNRRFSSLVDEDQSLALINLSDGTITQITPNDRHASKAAFSPDGKQLAFFQDRNVSLRAYLNLKDLVIRDLASGEQKVLTHETEMNLGGSGSTPRDAPIWDPGCKSLYLRGAWHTTLDLYRVDAGDGTITPVTDLAGEMSAFDIQAGVLAYLETELHRPGSLYVRSLEKQSQPREIVSTNPEVADLELQSPERLVLPGHDGGTVEGFLFLPPSSKKNIPLPTIIEMHGGPYSRYGNYWTTRYPWHVLSQQGFAVFIANPRGGTAYGEASQQASYRNYGTDDYLDLMAAVDALIERRIADPKHLGFTGYSYGGLMTNSVISRTERFQAAVSIAGIYNYVSAMGQSNPQLIIDGYQQPWAGDLQRLWEHSPASRADKIRTPTLIMHGKDDKPVDPRQSIELFSYMQLNGVPSRLVLYPGEGHGISKPSHMLDYQTRELEWFRHYLMNDQDAAGAEPAVPVE